MVEPQSPRSTAYTRTLRLAADTLGGAAVLARRLQVELAMLERWIAGSEFPPHEVFLKALDIVAGGTLLSGPKNRAHRAQARADRIQAAANRIRESAERLQSSAELAQAQAALLRKGSLGDGKSANGKFGQIKPKDGPPAQNKPAEPQKKKSGDG